MINLLPQEYQTSLAKERFQRFIIVAGILCLILVLVALILLLPAIFSVKLQQKVFQANLDIAQKNTALNRVDEISNTLRDLNNKIELFNAQAQKVRNISTILKTILDIRPHTIQIDSFTYKKRRKSDGNDQVLIYGNAETRDALLAFAEALRKVQYFTEVYLPPSNLLQKNDISFSLTIQLQ